ncbi:hypothetical protein KEM55_009299 [Ascosphaera atra]|nr:hypothetical protein KEM55_009299 [Ascosphaera atra]
MTAGNLKEGKEQQDNGKPGKEANKSHNKAGNGTAKGAKGLSKQSNTPNKTATPSRIYRKGSRSRRKMAFANVSETRLRNWLRLRGALRGTADRLTSRDVRLRVFMLGRTRFSKKAWREGWDAEARSKRTKGKDMTKGIRPAKVSKQERSMYMEIFEIMRDSLMKGGTRNKSETGGQEKALSKPKKLVPSLIHPESISSYSPLVQLPRELGIEARSINRLFMASALKPGKKFERDPKTGVRRLLPKLSNERATDIIRGKTSGSEGPNERELQEWFDDWEVGKPTVPS